MTEEQNRSEAQHWLETELDDAEDCRVMAGPVSDDHRDSQLEGLSIISDEAHEALLGNDYRKLITTVGFLRHDAF